MKQFCYFLTFIIFFSAVLLSNSCNNQAIPSDLCNPVKRDGLWNCDKKNCKSACMLQVGTIHKPGDTTWKDIPGANLNPDDLKKDSQVVRCDCR